MAKQNKKLAQVFHFDLQGKRDEKYDFLNENSLESIPWNELNPDEPNYFLVNKNFEGRDKYEKGFKVDELFTLSASGIKTQRDDASIAFTKNDCNNLLNDFKSLSEEDLKIKYGYVDVRDWKVSYAKEDLIKNKIIADKLMYRPFDYRYMNYTGKTKGIMGYPRFNIMQHYVKNHNTGLILSRQFGGGKHFICFISSKIIEISSQPFAPYNFFPLYLYPEPNAPKTIGHISYSPLSEGLGEARIPNLNPEIIQKIADKLGLNFVPEKEPEGNVCYINNPEVRDDFKTTFAPIDLLDYIYAVLHSPTYREKYKEFLKIDFPRVPYPKDTTTFWQLVKLGGEIRQIHLLESPTVEKYITQYPIDGDNKVGKVVFGNWKVYINYEKASLSGRLEGLQYFDNVPEIAWNFYIGGYQPAQKWLKDRKNRKLEFDDILHYQKIIVALSETDRLMKEIDKIEIE